MYWFELATTHYAVVLMEGIVIGYVLKYAVDALFSHLSTRRERKVEDLDSMMEEMFWQGASAQSRLDATGEASSTNASSINAGGSSAAALPHGNRQARSDAAA